MNRPNESAPTRLTHSRKPNRNIELRTGSFSGDCKLSDYSLNVDNLIVSWNDQIGLEALFVTIHEGPAYAL